MAAHLLYLWFWLINVMVLHVLQSHQTLMLSKLVSMTQQTLLTAEVNKTSAPIGAWNVTLKIMTDRPTIRDPNIKTTYTIQFQFSVSKAKHF